MEGWALTALEHYMSQTGRLVLIEQSSGDERRTLALQGSNMLLKEWLPEGRSEDYHLSIIEPESQRLRPKFPDHEKTQQDFDYVFCIGGDGTLLRLLRILFFRFVPPTLPKIVTFSMGSLGYLCNF